MSSGEPTAPEGASTGPEEAPAPAASGRGLTEEELRRYGEELQRVVGRAGLVAAHGGALHLRVSGRRNLRACQRAASKLTHWPAGVVVRVHRVEPKRPEVGRAEPPGNLTPEEVAERLARVAGEGALPKLTSEDVERFIAVSEMKRGRPYTQAEREGLRASMRGGLIL